MKIDDSIFDIQYSPHLSNIRHGGSVVFDGGAYSVYMWLGYTLDQIFDIEEYFEEHFGDRHFSEFDILKKVIRKVPGIWTVKLKMLDKNNPDLDQYIVTKISP